MNFCEDVEDELSMFPKATNDDASDSLAYQQQMAIRPEDDIGEQQTIANENDITATW